ncbi:MAG: tetratricopeptide repeat protein [Lentisphaeria bacterium]|nr:tetratricopeptide repeat protein [Lentisphaeria bacterium]
MRTASVTASMVPPRPRDCGSLPGRVRAVLPRLLLLCSAVVLLFPVPCPAQEMGPRETQDLLRRVLNQGAYAEAVPLIQQLIEWFKDSSKPSLQRDLEMLRFQLGLCHYLTGDFAHSEPAFKEYLAKHRNGSHASEAAVYLGDGFRFTSKFDPALKQYEEAVRTYPYNDDWLTDILCSVVRCHLAKDNWKGAIPVLRRVYRMAPDDVRANWAATLLCIAYLKALDVEEVFDLVPYLMQPDSPASRNVVFNAAALEAGDALFAEERYREALWIYRLVYPRDVIEKRGRRHVAERKADVADLREQRGAHRELLRAQEELGEAEADLEALQQLPDYAVELRFRIARSYMEIHRYREARCIFLYLRGELDPEQAETPHFLAFHCSTQIEPWDRAIELGREYMRDYPKGEYYDTVSLTVGQMYAVWKDWPRVIEVLTEALDVHPEHENIAECMFLIGYASFMEEKYADAIRWLKDLNTRFPNHERIEESSYWLGMAYLFNKNYEEAFAVFDGYVRDFPKGPYSEDATFRRAVCQYGLSRFREAEESFLAFAASYPESPLLGELYMMLADISGNFGALLRAVERYGEALRHELNIELYNYCNFRLGEMLADLEDFETIVSHFKAYIERNREGSNLPLAVYWVARGLWQQDRQQEAMTYLLDAVDSYGRDPDALGVDLIIEEWVSRSRNLPPTVAKEAWRTFGERLVAARQEDCLPLILRIEHIFLFNPGLTDKAREIILANLMREEAVPEASPAILEYLIDEAPARGKPELAALAAERILAVFPETDYVLSARMFLARRAIENGDTAAAEEQLRSIREVFATSLEAARALMLLGGMYMKQRRFSDADRCFQDVLGVREWRGPLWPEALYARGECAREQRQYNEATAYYERIYVLYDNYREWAAKAYLQRAKCLLRLQEDDKARQTLTEFLAREALADLPETTEARDLMAKFERRTDR